MEKLNKIGDKCLWVKFTNVVKITRYQKAL